MPNLAPQNMDQWMRDMERRVSRVEKAGQPRTLTPNRILLPGDADADHTVGNMPPFQIGDSTGLNLRIDANELMTSNNGSPSTLYINSDGGVVSFGSDVRMGASATGTNDAYLGSAKTDGGSVFYVGNGGANFESNIRMLRDGQHVRMYPSGTSLALAVGPGGTPTDSSSDTSRWYFDQDGEVHQLSVTGNISRYLPFAIQTGSYSTTNVATANGAAPAENTITFGTGRFTSPPVVFATAENGRFTISVGVVTAASCLIRGWNWTTTAVATGSVIRWMAVQARATGNG